MLQRSTSFYILRLIAASFVVFFWGCQKEKTALPVLMLRTAPLADQPVASVWFQDSMRGVAVGGKAWISGYVSSTTDGGLSWKVDTITKRRMECVQFSPDGIGHVVGQDAVLLIEPDKKFWFPYRTEYRWQHSCHFPDKTRGIIVSGESWKKGHLLAMGPEHFWESLKTDTFPSELSDVWYSDATTVHVVGMGWLMRSTDAGVTWKRYRESGAFLKAVHFPDAKTGYVCGESGRLLKSTDSGQTWTTLDAKQALGIKNASLQDVWFLDANRGGVVGHNGLLALTHDGGATWIVADDIPHDVDFNTIFLIGNRGWAGSEQGDLYYFEW